MGASLSSRARRWALRKEEPQPDVLCVFVPPNDHPECAGDYVLVPDRESNGMPVWRQVGGDCHLYATRGESWMISLSGADVDDQASKGQLSLDHHKGFMPHRAQGVWRVNEGKWNPNEEIVVTTAVPNALRLTAPNGPSQCVGDYNVEPGKRFNGMPVWTQTGGRCFLYSTRQGHWMVGFVQRDMEQNHGAICMRDHRNVMPHKVEGTWHRLVKNSVWRVDEQITVRELGKQEVLGREAPPVLRVKVPNCLSALAGEYALDPYQKINGMPLWQQMGGECHLFGSSHGNWMLCQTYAHISANVGVLSLRDHKGYLPHEASGVWERFVALGEWAKEPSVVISDEKESGMPTLLRVSGPPNYPGNYAMELGRVANGLPVWRQECGDCHLYGTKHGHWMLAPSSPAVALNKGDLILRDHCGLPPHAAEGMWECCRDNDGWKPDASVTIAVAMKRHVGVLS